jgi:Domain of unknown function (DUF4263)
VLGAHYRAITNHAKLDDANIPDFTGVRVKDSYRDIFEIKQPFVKIFRKDLEFTAEFNEAWNQAERYISFAREEHDYLRRKGLAFDNPRCYILIGYGLADNELRKIRAKEKLNPAIEVMTYNDVLVFAEETIKLIRKLSRSANKNGNSQPQAKQRVGTD